MDKPDLVCSGADKPGGAGFFAAFEPLATLQTERARIECVLDAVFPKIEDGSEFHALILLTVYRPRFTLSNEPGAITSQASIPTLAHVSHHWPESPNSRRVNNPSQSRHLHLISESHLSEPAAIPAIPAGMVAPFARRTNRSPLSDRMIL